MKKTSDCKKIAFLVPSMSEGGAQRVITILSREMARQGHNVRIIFTSKLGDAYEVDSQVGTVELKEWMENHSVSPLLYIEQKVARLWHKLERRDDDWVQNFNYFKKMSAGLHMYLNENPVDIVYSFLVGINIILGMAKLGGKTKIVIAERNFPDHDNNAIKALRDIWYMKADICVFQTEEQRECLKHLPLKKTVIIPNPIKEGLPLRSCEKHQKNIVNFCRLNPQKNLPLLIKVFSRIHKEYPEYSLCIYGNGAEKDNIQILINRLNLQECAKLIPFCSDIHKEILDAGMFVMTSDFEGMPNSLLEAMAMGLPCISTDCLGGGARAVIKHNINGMLVPIKDEDALYKAIKYLIENPEKAKTLGEKATEVRNDFSISRITQMWLDLME